MHRPQPAEEYITVIDNKGRERIQHVEYIVTDVRGETVYVTAGGLTYTEDSLARKAHYYLIDEHTDERASLTRRVLQHALASV